MAGIRSKKWGVKSQKNVYWVKVVNLEDKVNGFKERSWLEKVETKNVLKFFKDRVKYYENEEGNWRLELWLFGMKKVKEVEVEGRPYIDYGRPMYEQCVK